MHLLSNLLRFGYVLRSLGLDVHPGRMLDVARGLAWVDIGNRADFKHTLRTLLVHRGEDLQRFDLAFDAFWRAPQEGSTGLPLAALGEGLRARVTRGNSAQATVEFLPSTGTGHRETVDRAIGLQTYSPHDAPRTKDFAHFTPEEMAAARATMAAFQWDLAERRTRRWTRGRGRGLDLRRLVRRNLRYGGELLDLPRRQRKTRPRPLVLICDVSGSMERYSRMLLYFAEAMARKRDRVEAFVFATRLTRITTELRQGDPAQAVHVRRAVPDWAGGTRIGETLHAFNARWGRRVLAHGPVVLLISDGWDRGDVDQLRTEMAKLQRSCHRLIWLNPLLGSSTYEPLTRGMQAALGYVDDFLPVHNLASLESLARHLETLSPGRPARRQQRVATWK